MMSKSIILGLLVLGIVAVETESCHTSNNGITHSHVTKFIHEINHARSDIAKGKGAANMNVLGWNAAIAQSAQNCAARCPTSPQSCEGVVGDFGFITSIRSVSTVSDQIDPSAVVTTWGQDATANKQLFLAQETQVGCGRSVDDSTLVEYVVCVFDKKVSKEAPYIEGTAASACKGKTSTEYTGLCSTASTKHALIHNKKHNKHKKSHKKQKKQAFKVEEGNFIEADGWMENVDDPQFMTLNDNFDFL